MFGFSIFGRDADGNVPKGTLIGRLLNLVKESAMSNTKLSSTRLQAYFVLFSSLLYSVTFVIIEIANATLALTNGDHYVPSNESIIVLGMLLSHHLGILFSKPSPYSAAAPVVLPEKKTEQQTTVQTTVTNKQTTSAPPEEKAPDASPDQYAEAV